MKIIYFAMLLLLCNSCGYLNQEKIIQDEQLLLDTYHNATIPEQLPDESPKKKKPRKRNVQNDLEISQKNQRDLLEKILDKIKHKSTNQYTLCVPTTNGE